MDGSYRYFGPVHICALFNPVKGIETEKKLFIPQRCSYGSNAITLNQLLMQEWMKAIMDESNTVGELRKIATNFIV